MKVILRVKSLLIALALFMLMPIAGRAQAVVCHDDVSGLDFTLEETSPGILQTLITEILSVNIGNPALLNIDISPYTKATVVGPWSFAGDMVIPATVDAGDNAIGAIKQLALDLKILSPLTTGTYDLVVSTLEGLHLLSLNSGGIPLVALGTAIGDGAFINNKNITSLDMSSATNLKSIETHVFDGCSGLRGDLVIPDGVTTIGSAAFQNCSGLMGNLVISDGITTIENNVFYGCSGFTGNLVIPDGVTTIGTNAFMYCSSLRGNLVIPDRVTTIGNYAFSDCSGFTGNLTIGNSVTTIGNATFQNCRGLTGNLVIPDKVTTIGVSAFNNCFGLTGDVVLPSTVTNVGASAFSFCSSLRSLTFTSPTITVGASFANNCTKLEYIDLSESSFAMAMPTTFSRSNSTSTFYRVPSNTVIYLPDNAAGALSTTAAADNVNFVLGGNCALFNVEDGKDYFLPRPFTAKSATYSKAYNTGTQANTLYLPFDVTVPSGLTAYTLGYYNAHTSSATDNTFVFTPLAPNTTLTANTPYVVVGSGSVTGVAGQIVPKSPVGIGHNEVSPAAPNPVAGTQGKTVSDTHGNSWKFCGTTESTIGQAYYLGETWNYQSTWGSLTTYNLGDSNTWGYADVGIGSMRAFIAQTAGAPGAAMGKIAFANPDGTLTGIDGVNNFDNSVETRIYSISGQYMGKDFQSLPKGIYIVNGKKIIK